MGGCVHVYARARKRERENTLQNRHSYWHIASKPVGVEGWGFKEGLCF